MGFVLLGLFVIVEIALLVLTLFMIVGFQSGSTAGGMKQYRIAITCKSIYYDVKARLKKKREVMPRKINIYGEEKELTDERAFEEHNFALLYLSLIFLRLNHLELVKNKLLSILL